MGGTVQLNTGFMDDIEVEPENNENTGGKDRKEERYKLVRCDD